MPLEATAGSAQYQGSYCSIVLMMSLLVIFSVVPAVLTVGPGLLTSMAEGTFDVTLHAWPADWHDWIWTTGRHVKYFLCFQNQFALILLAVII